MKTWHDAVIDGITRLTKEKKSYLFSRQEIISQQLDQITREAQSVGETPAQTLSRVLQELRDERLVEFSDNQGNYISFINSVKIEDEDLPETAIDVAIKNQKLNFGEIPTGEIVMQIRQRKGQQRLRFWTLNNYQSQCALCDVKNPSLLVAAHLASWADFPEARGDLTNMVCLCCWHDPLIEYGIISFTDNYEILKKSTDSSFLNKLLQETKTYHKPLEMPLASEYLEIHRQRTGFE
jgi:hypothetical protein